MTPSTPILLVDDEHEALKTEELALQLQGIDNVLTCSDSRQAMTMVAEHGVGIVVLDILMPHLDGLELHRRIIEEHPDVTVILLTGVDDVATAVLCMKRGAFDYLAKPIGADRLVNCVRRAIEHRRDQQLSARLAHGILHSDLANPDAFAHIVTADSRLLDIFRYVEAIAPTDLPILLMGETGVGKEILARAIHKASGREGSFVPVDCAGVDDQFFSDTLFGHTRNAFTGAGGEREGLVKQAENGTLFLDEVGDMQPASQVKLLRLLQERVYYGLGADVAKPSSARVVAATNADLDAAAAAGRMRRDLYYRLQSHRIEVPPLRERKGDIPVLLTHFLAKAARDLGKRQPTAPPELIPLLLSHDFPGNIRELEGMVVDAVTRHPGRVLSCASFRDRIGARRGAVVSRAPAGDAIQFPDPLPTAKQAEAALVAEALKRASGNKTLAAAMLGLSRKTLRARLRASQGE